MLPVNRTKTAIAISEYSFDNPCLFDASSLIPQSGGSKIHSGQISKMAERMSSSRRNEEMSFLHVGL